MDYRLVIYTSSVCCPEDTEGDRESKHIFMMYGHEGIHVNIKYSPHANKGFDCLITQITVIAITITTIYSYVPDI